MPIEIRHPLPEAVPTPIAAGGRPTVYGKFFFVGDRKLYLRGVAYGPFAPAAHGAPFPDETLLAHDLALMAEAGVNCVRTFTVPPRWLLDRAGAHGVRVLVTIPWAEHVCFLDRPEVVRGIHEAVRSAARALGDHPALFGLLVGNEIPPDIVRWYGPERIQAFLGRLAADVRRTAPGVLVSYANFPSTEYLDVTRFADFVCYNVYLHREPEYRHYLSRLHNLAGGRPLVLTELGVDSIREGRDQQAAFVAWMVRAGFEGGAAGTFVFSWTDDWQAGGGQVADWAFGLVDANRVCKPAYDAVRAEYRRSLPPALPDPPPVSVVVCAHDAARTLDACLASLGTLNYPDYEIVLVDDGSTDGTLDIARAHEHRCRTTPGAPTLVVVHQENRGLAVARNVGAAAARGTIVAYTDSDCVADPDWLWFLVHPLTRGGRVAIGGPNFPPPEADRVAAAVAVAPGGPTHVLLNDDVAEHVPGCNMAFTREAFAITGGFAPAFVAAGDDVDLCWRLQNAGRTIGFSAAATVWHYRRNSVGAYLRQQRGYGKAEGLLYLTHPFRFNLLGQSQWLGRIYGELTANVLSRRPLIYFGTFGRALFQSLYEPPSSLLAHIPFTLEWNALGLALLFVGFVSPRVLPVAILPLLLSVGLATIAAARAPLDPRYTGLCARALVAFLTYAGPLVRGYQRYRWRLRGAGPAEPVEIRGPRQTPGLDWRKGALRLRYWSDAGHEKEALLGALMRFLVPRKYLVAIDPGWNRWDLEIFRGVWAKARVTVAAENHGGAKRLLNVRCELRPTRVAQLAALLYGVAVLLGHLTGAPEVVVTATLLAAVTLAVVGSETLRLGRILGETLDIVGTSIGLHPVTRPPNARAPVSP